MTKFIPALALLAYAMSLSAVRGGETIKPLGKWQRQAGKNRVTLIVEENRLHVTLSGEESLTLHADYNSTRDGVIYGVITSIEDAGDEDDSNTIIDAPFSCRYRLDEGALIVRDLRCLVSNSADKAWNGSFKPVNSGGFQPVNPPVSRTSFSSSTPTAFYTPMGIAILKARVQPVKDRNIPNAYYRQSWFEILPSEDSKKKEPGFSGFFSGYMP